MISTMVIIQKSNSWKGLGKVDFLQLPRIGETVSHTKDGKAVWFKVINVAHKTNPIGSSQMIDIYAVETADPNIP